MMHYDILITGSSGFVGRYLCSLLKKLDFKILGIDKIDINANHDFIKHDLTTPLDYKITSDFCIHLASSVGGIIFNQSEKSDIISYNNLLNLNIFNYCQEIKCKKFIFFSSINIFESDISFLHAKVKIPPNKTPYAISKYNGENFFIERFDNLSIIRPTNIFGKFQCRSHHNFGESHVIPDLLEKIRDSNYISVFGDGTQKRNFVHVSDIVNFTHLALKFNDLNFFNLRSELTLSISSLAYQLSVFSQKEITIKYIEEYMRYETFEIKNFNMAVPNKFGWISSINSLNEGLLV